mmetsp:Transcript_29592/g.94499  ORF Transcript_29592/g.94499 Transcript_29592/m.94499 type:complete len:273 (-) Transcript_29592:93-911(-)
MEGELEAVERGHGAQVGLPLARRVVGAELVNLALGRHLERWLVRPAGGGRGRRDGDGARGRRPRRGPSRLGRVDRAGHEVLHEQHPGAPEQSREEQVQRVLELVLDGGGEDDGARRGGGMHHFELQHQRDGERGRKDLFEHRVQLERCDRQRRAHRERVASECVLRLAERRRRSREEEGGEGPKRADEEQRVVREPEAELVARLCTHDERGVRESVCGVQVCWRRSGRARRRWRSGRRGRDVQRGGSRRAQLAEEDFAKSKAAQSDEAAEEG